MTELTKTFELTIREMTVALILFEANGCGASRPSDFENDEFTWVDTKDLIKAGYSKEEVGGFFSSLEKKGFLEDHHEGYSSNGRDDASSPFITTEGWQWLDTVFDEEMGKWQNRINEVEQNKLIAEQSAVMKTPQQIALEIMAQIEAHAEEQASADQFHNNEAFHKSHIIGALEALIQEQEAVTQ